MFCKSEISQKQKPGNNNIPSGQGVCIQTCCSTWTGHSLPVQPRNARLGGPAIKLREYQLKTAPPVPFHSCPWTPLFPTTNGKHHTWPAVLPALDPLNSGVWILNCIQCAEHSKRVMNWNSEEQSNCSSVIQLDSQHAGRTRHAGKNNITLLLLPRKLSWHYNLEQRETCSGLYTSRASVPPIHHRATWLGPPQTWW